MRNSVLGPSVLIAGLCALPVAASAESYICAVSEVYDCAAVEGCKRVSTDAINLAELIVLDTDKKTLTGASMNENAAVGGHRGPGSDREEHLSPRSPG